MMCIFCCEVIKEEERYNYHHIFGREYKNKICVHYNCHQLFNKKRTKEEKPVFSNPEDIAIDIIPIKNNHRKNKRKRC